MIATSLFQARSARKADMDSSLNTSGRGRPFTKKGLARETIVEEC